MAVLLSVLGLWGVLWGFGLPARVSVGFAAAVLTVACVALLVDVEELL